MSRVTPSDGVSSPPESPMKTLLLLLLLLLMLLRSLSETAGFSTRLPVAIATQSACRFRVNGGYTRMTRMTLVGTSSSRYYLRYRNRPKQA